MEKGLLAGSKGQDTKANNKNKVRRNKKKKKRARETETQEKYITKIEEPRQQIVQQTKEACRVAEGEAEGEREGGARREAVTISAHLKVSNILFMRFGPRPTNTLFFVTKLSRKL